MTREQARPQNMLINHTPFKLNVKHQIVQMSYSVHHRKSLDSTLSIEHRISHVRSCAVHMSQKYRVSRSEVLRRINILDKYDHDNYPTEAELENAIARLDLIKAHGLDNV
jgi:hypothetical protein